MEFKKYKEEIVKDRQDTIEFLSNERKKEREVWVTKQFLNVLGLSYTVNEVRPVEQKDEPPDVTFGDASFEIMEVMDEGRERHKEYKDELKKTKAADDYSGVLHTPIGGKGTWDLKMISLQELLVLAEERLQKKNDKYSVNSVNDVKATLDALIYINLQERYIEDENFVFALPEDSSLRQWRSASLVFNSNMACVAFASSNAPAFIRSASNKVIKKTQDGISTPQKL